MSRKSQILRLIYEFIEHVHFPLDFAGCLAHYLNMFNSSAKPFRARTLAAGDHTRELILKTALDLFRRGGFEVTTMRDIAHAAKVATGAAYYYFQSKEGIVAAYYDQVQRLHADEVKEELKGKDGLRERLGVVMHSKLEILRDDRLFLGALFRYTGDPRHPLSVFGKGTQSQRTHSVAIFKEAIADANVSDELRQLLPMALWLGHLGMILFFIYDESEGQQRTHKLVDGALDLLAQFMELASSALVRPFFQPFQTKMLEMLRAAGWE
jgi:AcrR family transcriptional regulator